MKVFYSIYVLDIVRGEMLLSIDCHHACIISDYFYSMAATEHQRHRKKENFLRQFRDEQSKEIKQLTATQFMEIWSHYDVDGIK